MSYPNFLFQLKIPRRRNKHSKIQPVQRLDHGVWIMQCHSNRVFSCFPCLRLNTRWASGTEASGNWPCLRTPAWAFALPRSGLASPSFPLHVHTKIPEPPAKNNTGVPRSAAKSLSRRDSKIRLRRIAEAGLLEIIKNTSATRRTQEEKSELAYCLLPT